MSLGFDPHTRPMRLSTVAKLRKASGVFVFTVMATWFYLIHDKDSGLTKIGRSNDPQRRLRQLTRQATLLPKRHNFELIFQSRHLETFETAVHSEYKHKRVRGEWFDLSKDDCDFIKAWAREISVSEFTVDVDGLLGESDMHQWCIEEGLLI